MSGDCVYFIKHPVTGLIKVGYSGQVSVRLRQLCSTERAALELMGTVPGARDAEQRLHAAMAAFRDHGEWFRPNTLIEACLEISRLINVAVDREDPEVTGVVPWIGRTVMLQMFPERVGPAAWDHEVAAYWGEWEVLL